MSVPCRDALCRAISAALPRLQPASPVLNCASVVQDTLCTRRCASSGSTADAANDLDAARVSLSSEAVSAAVPGAGPHSSSTTPAKRHSGSQRDAVKHAVRALQALEASDLSVRSGVGSSVTVRDRLTVARTSGRYSDSELRALQSSCDNTEYPSLYEKDYEPGKALPMSGPLYHPLTIEGMQMDVIRRSNLSLPLLKGQRIYGTVYCVTGSRVYVDAGHSSLAVFKRKQLHVADLVSSTEVGREGRLHAHDVRAGDRFVFSVADPACPLGSIWLEPVRLDPESSAELVWAEIEDAFKSKKGILGRILNETPGGYSVGIAGFVGFMPFRSADTKLTSKLGQLQMFRLSNIDSVKKRFYVLHPSADAGVLSMR